MQLSGKDEQVYQQLHIAALLLKRVEKHLMTNPHMAQKYLARAWVTLKELMDKIQGGK